MFYRRKIILALLQTFGGNLAKVDFQKLLFILSNNQDKPSYSFVPYKFGCFSFQSYADIRTMIKYGQIIEEKNTNESFSDRWIKTDNNNYLDLIKKQDLLNLNLLKDLFGKYNTEDLIKYTYRKYPYYAINSTVAGKYLTKTELKEIEKSRPTSKLKCLFTLGYEGISLENYLNKLLSNDIRILCDIRKNPLSMKYGFSKNQLKTSCEKIGIEYIHIPELGIHSAKRQELNSQKDYDKLFRNYRKTTLNKNKAAVKQVIDLLGSKSRVALTCFEANINQCHRKHLADTLTKHIEWKYEVKHI